MSRGRIAIYRIYCRDMIAKLMRFHGDMILPLAWYAEKYGEFETRFMRRRSTPRRQAHGQTYRSIRMIIYRRMLRADMMMRRRHGLSDFA